MKKDKRTAAQRGAALKRATKRGIRLKKTQSQKFERKAALKAEEKHKALKFQEAMDKLLQARGLK